jgi:hypothetical protein
VWPILKHHFGHVRTRKEIAVMVRLFRAQQNNMRNQINQQPSIELHVGVDRSDLKDAVFQQLGNTQALWTGERKIHLPGYAELNDRQVLRPANAGDDEVKVVKPFRIAPRKSARKEVRQLLIVTFQHDAIERSAIGPVTLMSGVVLSSLAGGNTGCLAFHAHAVL